MPVRRRLRGRFAPSTASRPPAIAVPLAATTGLLTPDTRTIGIYHDDPESVPQAELRSAACITAPEGWAPAGELAEGHVEGGRYARIVHTGPYTELETA